MPDQQQETGAKWWLRYVLVPILGSGGVVAIVVAVVDYRAKLITDQAQQTKSSISVGAVPQPMPSHTTRPLAPLAKETTELEHKPPNVSPNIEVAPKTVQVRKVHPISEEPHVDPDPIQKLSVTDAQFSTEYTGRNITVTWGTEYYIAWTVNKNLLKGSLLVRFDGYEHPTEAAVGADSSQHFNCPSHDSSARTQIFKLIEIYDDDTRHELATIKIHCQAVNE